MTITLSSASLPGIIKMLNNLSHLLAKAEQFVEQKKCDPTALTQYRLAPDMFPLTKQVFVACDMAKNGMARISGLEAPKFDDSETTFEQLRARIQKTLDYLASIPASTVDGKEENEITFPVGPNTRTMKAEAYLVHWILPNMFFHITTVYNILRHNGVEIGKRDFLAGESA